MSDPWFSGHDTRLYYESLAEPNGGAEAVRGFSRLFLVPGMGHCSGGAAAPDRVVSTGDALEGRSRPLCGYPEYAHYVGGDPEAAASFECRRP